MSTNYGQSSALVTNGLVTLQESLNDYPKLTLLEYVTPGISRRIGDIINYAGLAFTLESLSIEKCPIVLNNIEDKITYNFIHTSSKILEYPIFVKDFIEKNTYVKQTNTSYFYAIGTLVSYAKGKGRIGSVNPPGFLVALNKSPSFDETITLRDLIDDKLDILQLVYDFRGDGVSFVPLGSKGNISPNIVRNYTIGYGNVGSYKDSPLSWNKKNEQEAENLEVKKYKKLKDAPYILYEGDYNPHLPPPETYDNTKFPRDLSIMFDNSGVTKTCKITKYVWNKPEVEIEATFGFAHAAVELVADPNKPNVQSDRVIALMSEAVIESGNAYQEILASIKSGKYGYPDDADFSNDIVWRLISIKEKEYIYEPLNVIISPRLKKEDGTYKSVTIAPELSNFTSSSVQVLVREVTKGWELKRFAQEDPQNWTAGSIQSWIQLTALVALKDTLQNSSILAKQQYYWMLYYAKLNIEKYLYRKIPIWEQVDYGIEPYSSYYKDSEKVDWQVKYIEKNKLDEYKMSDDNDLVPVVYPDPNWEPSLMLLAQSRLKMSIGLSGNPNYDPYTRNYFGTNPISITTGSEEYELTIYNVLPSKNTKSNRAPNYVNIPNVISAIENQIEIPGTYYQEKQYVTIPDYGIKEYPIPQVNPSKVRAGQIGSLDTNDDQYTSLTSLRVAQDHSYKNHLTTTTFTIADGRPPQATTRKPIYEEVQDDSKTNPYTNTQTLITSSNYSPFTNVISNVSVSSAENLQEALRAASFKLTLEGLNASSTSVTLHYPTGNISSLLNSKINIPGTNSSWVIKGASQTIQFTESTGFPQPIELECGILMFPGISNNTIQVNDDNDNGQDSVEIEVNANLPRRYGTPIEDIPNNFGRWLDTN